MQDADVSAQIPAPIEAQDAIFLDFDGTLAPIQDDAAAVTLQPPVAQRLIELAEQLSGALAIISGRDIRDLSTRTPTALWRVGGHGLEVCEPGQSPLSEQKPAPAALVADLESLAAQWAGVFVERKGPILALHYRAAADAGAMLADAAAELVAAQPGYVMQHGKMVIELKPAHANKGAALRRLMEAAPFMGRRPVMVGDDVTDEDAFRAAAVLGGKSLKVGEGATVAVERVSEPSDVHAWLMRGIGG